MAYGIQAASTPHLPRHLLFRILAYRLQADRLGDLDAASRRLLSIDSQRQHDNLSSAIRLFVLDFYRAQLSDARQKSGMGNNADATCGVGVTAVAA
jgi:hypothetical protein